MVRCLSFNLNFTQGSTDNLAGSLVIQRYNGIATNNFAPPNYPSNVTLLVSLSPSSDSTLELKNYRTCPQEDTITINATPQSGNNNSIILTVDSSNIASVTSYCTLSATPSAFNSFWTPTAPIDLRVTNQVTIISATLNNATLDVSFNQ